jgi:hypothetical protein
MIQIGFSAWKVDVAQREQRQRGRHLLVEDEEQHGLQRQHQGRQQAGALALRACTDQVHEDAQHDDAGGVHEDARQRLVFEDHGRDADRHHAARQHGQQLTHRQRLLVRLRADVGDRRAHDQHVEQADHQAHAAHAERGVPAELVAIGGVDVILDPGRGQHRHGRADVHRHVVQGEGAVDAGIVAFVDLAHQVGGVRLEQAVADHDHAKRPEQHPGVVAGDGHQRIRDGEDDRAQDHRALGAQHLVADPAADGGRDVDQGRGRAPHEVGLAVAEAQALDHEVHDQRLHAVVAEALP